MEMDIRTLEENVANSVRLIDLCRQEIGKRIVGQSYMIDGILMGMLAGGHVLLEGVPGLAKTLSVKTLAEVVDVGFKRIQFTPDLLPADLIGTMVYRQQTGEFVPRKGPVFTNIVLADEINRAPAKVQSALLEAMEEHQVTIGTQTYQLPKPFFVLATQNPIEQEGTYSLPEAQLDRFLMKLVVDYPTEAEELDILHRMGVQQELPVKKILNPSQIGHLKDTAKAILVDERIERYIVSIIAATREKDRFSHNYVKYIEYGASTRASLYLYRCAKIKALFENRTFVIPDDVKSVAVDILRHRIVLSYEAESEERDSEDVVKEILKVIPCP